jgi:hypothetical protein
VSGAVTGMVPNDDGEADWFDVDLVAVRCE